MSRSEIPQSSPEHSIGTNISTAVDALRRGFVVLFPTDTVYALAVDPSNEMAVRRLFAGKRRDLGKAIPLIAADMRQVDDFAALRGRTRILAEAFWPGPLTLLVNAPRSLPSAVHGGTRKVGIRVPAHPVARELARQLGRPITATSANLSGDTPITDLKELSDALREVVSVVIDDGPLAGAAVSTIVDADSDPPVLIRHGAISMDEVERVLLHGSSTPFPGPR